METPPDEPFADGSLRRLDPAFIRVESIVCWITTACLGGAGAVGLVILVVIRLLAGAGSIATWVLLLVAGVWAIVTTVAVTFTLWWPRASHRRSSYVLSRSGLEIRRGVIWRTILSVPRARVQHADVVEGPILRRHGLATLVVYTAGTAHAAVTLQGLARETALRIRDELLPGDADDGV